MATGWFPRAELNKIPHLRSEVLRGRSLPTLAFYTPVDGWQLWIDSGGVLERLLGEPAEADYFGTVPEAEADICLYFVDFIGRRVLAPDTLHLYAALRHDVHNLGASLAKIDYFVEQHRLQASLDLPRFATTELEYLLVVCRSMFDLFQKFFSKLWGSVRMLPARTPTVSLPSTFSAFVLQAEQPRSVENFQEKYGLPPPICSAFRQAAEFFQAIRGSRDRIVHHGHWLPIVFATERGLAMYANTEPFSDFRVWQPSTFLPNDLASLRPVLAFLVWRTFLSFDEILTAFERSIQLQPDPVPGFSLFMRGYHTGTLKRYSSVSPDDPWWPS